MIAPGPRRTPRSVLLKDTPTSSDRCAILSEVASEDGVVLWKVLGDVTTWLDTTADARSDLFRKSLHVAQRYGELTSTSLPKPLVASLLDLSHLISQAQHTTEAKVSGMCLRIAQLLNAERLLASAEQFAQTAARAAPDDFDRAPLRGAPGFDAR